MTTFVVPLDGSECAERALHPACALAARADGGRVVLVTCAGGRDRASDAYLDDRAALLGGVADIAVRVVDDTPADGILAAVSDEPGARLCMATHGHGGLRSVVLGSVAEQVVCRSTDPLVLVGPRSRAVLLPGERGRMAVCHDGSDHAAAIVGPAATWARRFGLAPWLVEVAGPDEVVAFADDPARHRQVEAATAGLARLAEIMADRGVPTGQRVLHGADTSAAITRFAVSLPACLLAMATHGRSGLARVTLGSVAMAVVREAPCPVLIVRPAGIAPRRPGPDRAGATI